MNNVPDIREFLHRYHEGQSYLPAQSVPTEGDRPVTAVRDAQRATGQDPDEHVIPELAYEYRLNTGASPSANEIPIDEHIHLIERYWGALVDQYGLDGVVTYLPFHEDPAAYGIYISQRGIRYLGHLLYNWSKVFEPVNGTLPTRPSGTPMQYGYLIAGSRLRNKSAAFDSLEDAFDFAYEILRRYGWLHHQTELLAAYLEDAQNEVCYPSYQQHYREIAAPEADLSRAVGHQYVARSRACQNAAPTGLFQPLLERTLRAFEPPADEFSLTASDGFEQGRRELSRRLRDGFKSTTVSAPIELSNRVPFSTNIGRTVPDQIALYITRCESDPADGSFANRPGVISLSNQTTYAIEESSTYEKKYNNNPELQDRLDNRVERIRNSFEAQNWKGVTDGPDDKRYIDVTGSVRLVVSVDEDEQSIELLDFGDRMEIPPKHGLHKSQN